jgi:anti-sigma B factor antagonist
MTIGETTFGGARVVKADGRIDLSNADDFKDALVAAVANAGSAVTVDLSGVDYISSAGLRALMIASRSAKSGKKGFAIAGLTPLVAEIFTISRFDKVFATYPDVREALAAVAPDGLASFDAS